MFNNKKTLFSAILIIAILSISVSTVLGASDDNTVYVSPTGNDANIGSIDSPLKTIAKAVELAPDHGEVFLKAGTYHGEGTLKISKNVSIVGENQATTIIDGPNLWFDTPTPWYDLQDITVKGLTLKTFLNTRGCDKFIVEDCTFNDQPLITGRGSITRNCTFINNHADSFGGAIQVKVGPSTISDCNFINNSVSDSGWHVPGSTAYSGGAIYANAFGVTINNCNFSGNSAEQYGDDIYHAVGTMWINNCLFDNQSNPSAKSVSQGDGSYHLVIDGVDRGLWA